jgi:RNA polymerase sigma factor (sigma-70 family)
VLTIDTIRAAQDNDLAAVAQVIEATESRIAVLARKAANRMAPHGGARFHDYADEFAQVGRVAVWDLLKRFTDTTAEAFFKLTYTTVENTLKDAVRSERNGNAGADENAVKVFAAMLEAADGDVYEAAKLSQVLPPKGKRLSADRAEAARLAWQGAVSLDKVTTSTGNPDADGSLADVLIYEDDDLDGEIRPKVGRGAVIEAAHVLYRYVTVPRDAEARVCVLDALELAAMGETTPADVEALEDAVRVPLDPTERRYVLDALAVIRSSVSTATETALTDDLRDVREERMADSREKHARVNDTLDSMGAAQRDVLRHSFGIKGVTDFGWGDSGDLEGLCAYLDMTSQNVRAHRAKGRKAFAKRYAAAVSITDPTHAQALTVAAAAILTNAGRK